MACVNKVIIIGKLQKDANIGTTSNEKLIANLEVITDESYTAKDGKKVDKYEKHKIVAWGKQADFCRELKKDQQVFIEGKNQTRKTDEGPVNEVVAQDIQLIM